MLDFFAIDWLLLVLNGFLILLRHDDVPSSRVNIRKLQMLVGYRVQSVISSDHMNQRRRSYFMSCFTLVLSAATCYLSYSTPRIDM